MEQGVMAEHRFYHADRAGTLEEGQELCLDQNAHSFFGRIYVERIAGFPPDQRSDAENREALLDEIRRLPHLEAYQYPSRFRSFFCANSIEEAARFAQEIVPRPDSPIRIFEVFATHFWNRDSNWLDLISSPQETFHNYFRYWTGVLTNHAPLSGTRIPPRIEVVIDLPARIGKIVHVVPGPQIVP